MTDEEVQLEITPEDEGDDLAPVREWVQDQEFLTTAEIEVPPRLVDQVIGQDHASRVVKKAAEQRRHVLLLGDPGTGKSMLARAMAEMLPPEELEDVLAYPNPDDQNEPKVRVVPAGKGKEIVSTQKLIANDKKQNRQVIVMMVIFAIIILGVAYSLFTREPTMLFMSLIAAAFIFLALRYIISSAETANVPKLLVGHDQTGEPPFIDATGSHAGALLGDVKHDPFQSGGLETPAHDRVEAGGIHKGHKGVLYIDEINLLRMESQQALLTAMQDKKYAIMGQSERSSGAMVKTEAVPCDFILVAAGNLDAMEGMHPALRSRLRGYGYEVYVSTSMADTAENRSHLIRFVAQEVKKDGKIPHFNREAVAQILHEAQRRAGRRGRLSLRLRELGGLIRVAGDVALERGKPIVTVDDVLEAKKVARSMEQQIVDRMIEQRLMYREYRLEGAAVGYVNGLAVLGAGGGMMEYSGMMLPLEAAVTTALSKSEGKIIATGKLGEIAQESVLNVSALIKKITGKDITNFDVHIQFVGSTEGTEGDSASVSIATAVISALEDIPVDSTLAMTGSLSIRGEVLPVGGVTAKIEAAAKAGIKTVIIPHTNMQDVLLEDRFEGKIRVIPVKHLQDVLNHALIKSTKKEGLMERLTSMVGRIPGTSLIPGSGAPV